MAGTVNLGKRLLSSLSMAQNPLGGGELRQPQDTFLAMPWVAESMGGTSKGYGRAQQGCVMAKAMWRRGLRMWGWLWPG